MLREGDASRRSPWVPALLSSFLFILIVYPSFLTLSRLPMAPGGGDELQDPVVSHMTLIPGQRTLVYELTNHFNLLWSSLRGLGGPVLGADVQAAPMFPLTLLTVGIAERSLWNVVAVLRLMLLGTASFMIAWRVFRFRLPGSVVFSYTLAFGLNTVRWMNHPFQNGLCASLWYGYFIWSSAASSREPLRRRIWPLTGIALSIYSVITCGFPEAMVCGAALVACGLLLPVLSFMTSDDVRLPVFLQDAAMAHVIGIAVAMPQVFVLTGYVDQAAPGFRVTNGLAQAKPDWPLSWVLRTSDALLPLGTPVQIFGLITIFLLTAGFIRIVLGQFHRSLSWRDRLISCAGLLPGVVYVLKVLPVWPSFNAWIGSLPILQYMWFPVYFVPMLLWTAGYLAGEAADAIRFGKMSVWTLVAAGLVTVTLGIVAASRSGVSVGAFLRLRDVAWFGVFLGCLALGSIGQSRSMMKRPLADWAAIGMLAILIIESRVTRPTEFLRYDSDIYRAFLFWTRNAGAEIANVLRRHEIRTWEMRERDQNGSHVRQGIATVDLGATAILPQRLQMIRTALFETAWSGHLPLAAPRFPYSWQALSATIYLDSPDGAQRAVGDPNQRLEILGLVGGAMLMRDHAALPRAYLTRHCEFVGDANAALNILKDPGTYSLGLAVLETSGPTGPSVCSAGPGVPEYKQVPILEDRGQTVALQAVQGPGVLVLNDNFDEGWRAIDRVSGQAFEIKHANVAFRAVVLEESRPYEVTFEYRPGWLTGTLWGIAGAVLAWVALVIVAFRPNQD